MEEYNSHTHYVPQEPEKIREQNAIMGFLHSHLSFLQARISDFARQYVTRDELVISVPAQYTAAPLEITEPSCTFLGVRVIRREKDGGSFAESREVRIFNEHYGYWTSSRGIHE